MDEFQLIDTFFHRTYEDQQIICGSGDDAACIRPTPEHLLCVSTDTLVEGVHFLSEWNPSIIASKAVIANVSDMAAMAAIPKWVTVALTLPKVEQYWLKSFAQGLFASLDTYHVALIGGDVTKGPLTISITIHGECLPEQVTYRHGAKVDDIIYITAPLGAPALAVDWLDIVGVDKAAKDYLMDKLQHPKARTDCQKLISLYANSCIDISDGLLGDLSHICKRSGFGATLFAENIPVDLIVKEQVPDKALYYALNGGDEYQLCFTVSDSKREEAEKFANKMGLSIYPIGHIIQEQQIYLCVNGICNPIHSQAYMHFK